MQKLQRQEVIRTFPFNDQFISLTVDIHYLRAKDVPQLVEWSIPAIPTDVPMANRPGLGVIWTCDRPGFKVERSSGFKVERIYKYYFLIFKGFKVERIFYEKFKILFYCFD